MSGTVIFSVVVNTIIIILGFTNVISPAFVMPLSFIGLWLCTFDIMHNKDLEQTVKDGLCFPKKTIEESEKELLEIFSGWYGCIIHIVFCLFPLIYYMVKGEIVFIPISFGLSIAYICFYAYAINKAKPLYNIVKSGAYRRKYHSSINEANAKAKEEQEKRDKVNKAIYEELYKKRNALLAKYGISSDSKRKSYSTKYSGDINLYPEEKYLELPNHFEMFRFDEIATCEMTDEQEVIKGKTTITTTTGTQKDNALKRAVVGGLIAGNVGAIVGGATAKSTVTSNSVVKQTPDKIIHHYRVYITMKDLRNFSYEFTSGGTARAFEQTIIAIINSN